MSEKEKLLKLEDMMDLEEGSLSPDLDLSSLDEWDSLAKLSLIVLFDDECHKHITGEDVRAFRTVRDILDCMEN